jgi:ribonuclease BN (tRNA processing enzyme)
MCGVGEAIEVSRRQWLQMGGAAVAGAMVAGPAVADAAARRLPAGRAHHGGDARPEEFRTRLALLGTAGGPAWWPGGSNGTSAAVVVDGRAYVVDCGDGVWRQYRETLYPPPSDLGPHALRDLAGVFFTNLLSDHTVDYTALVLFGASDLRDREDVVPVFGPGDRGSLPPLFGTDPAPPVINPANPTPGTVDLTNMIVNAYATDLNHRTRHMRYPDPRLRIEPHDIPLPPSIVADPNDDPAPDMEPFEIFADDRVRVTAILANHPPTFPSFAFRFDTDDGSIVFSGATSPEPNVVKLAKDADILVHEVIDPEWVRGLFPDPTDPVAAPVITHLLSAHTEIGDVGEVASQAGVKTLVLSHLVPANNPHSRWRRAMRGFDGRLVVGEDGAQLGVGRRRRRVR